MSCDILFMLVVGTLSGMLGGLFAAYSYQKNQRARDKRQWEEMTADQ